MRFDVSARVVVLLCTLVHLSRHQEEAPPGCGDFCCEDEDVVRLKGGRWDSEGYVEVCVDGVWGTVCDDHWDNRDAGVICNMLGYHRENAIASKFARFVTNHSSIENQPVVLARIQCEGDEESILQCPNITNEDCYEHIEDAGVICEEDTCEKGDVRLVGGSDAKEGRVEICQNGIWGTVCNDGWTDDNTLVVCTQLGLQDEDRDTHLIVDFGPGSTPPALTGVRCDGDEISLAACSSGELTQTCYAAGIMCDAPCHWQYDDPNNYGCSAIGVPEEDVHYNYDELCYCSQNCHDYSEWDPNKQKYIDRGDCCRDILLFDNCIAELRECQEYDVRIVDGTMPWNGRLEVCLGGLWGAVCEDQFEDTDATVACRHLGYPTTNAFAVPGGTFGAGKRMWLRGIECTGEEENFFHCQSSSPGYFHDCRPHNSTGIWCAGAAPEPNCTEGDVRLAGGVDELGGRVEICDGGVWGSVCNHEFGEWEARVVCNQLGFSESSSVVSTPYFGTGMGPIHLDDLKCRGNESSLLECNHPGLRVHNCFRQEEAAVTCRAEPIQRCESLKEPPALPADTILRYGKISLFDGTSVMCNSTYERGVDYVYFPLRLNELNANSGPTESLLSEAALNQKLEDEIGQGFAAASPECQQLFSTYICNSIFFRTDNDSGTISLPRPLCPDECRQVQRTCPLLWETFSKTDIGRCADCDRTGTLLEPLPYCCHGAGIELTGNPEDPVNPSVHGQSSGGTSNASAVAAGVSVTIILLLLLAALLAGGMFLLIRKFRNLKNILHGREEAVNTLEMLSNLHGRRDSSRSLILNGKSNGASAAAVTNHLPVSRQMSDDLIRYSRTSLSPFSSSAAASYYPALSPISSRYLRQLTTDMLIPQSQLRLLDSIGKGEFGIVYKAHYLQGVKNGRTMEPQIVAVKTLKGYFDKEAIHVLLEESVKMKEFNHPNVLTLFGVCVDAGPAPYIVMPYMAKGSLLSYLRKERHNILVAEQDDEEDVEDVRRKLLDIIHQIAKGMAYLAERKFVHRDLATRNCMMDAHNVIRVSDFGLSEDMYAKNYFRQDKDASVKLPIKWMAPESLNDGLFTEKSDVWSYGVTCWEVFSAGKTPYPGVNPVSLVRILEDGERLEIPVNAACPQFAYKLMLECWNIEAEKRPAFSEIATKVDHIMEVTSGYLELSKMATQREGQAMTGERSETDSPESVTQLIRGVKTNAGITIQLEECGNSYHNEDSPLTTNETSV